MTQHSRDAVEETGGIEIDLPDDWYRTPATPDEFEEFWNRLDGIETLDPDIAHRARTQLRAMLVEAGRAGLLWSAAMTALVPGDDPDEHSGRDDRSDVDAEAMEAEAAQPEILTAAVTISVIRDESLDGSVSVFALNTLVRESEEEGTRTMLADPDIVYLGTDDLIEAVRTVEITSIHDEEVNADLIFLGVDYLMPTADRNGAIVLSFRTPAIWLLEEFTGLFHDIATTLRIVPARPLTPQSPEPSAT